VPNSSRQKERAEKQKAPHPSLIFLCAPLCLPLLHVCARSVFTQASHNQRETRSKTPDNKLSAKICVEPEKSYHSKRAEGAQTRHSRTADTWKISIEIGTRGAFQKAAEVHKKRRLSLTRYSRDTNEHTNVLLMAL